MDKTQISQEVECWITEEEQMPVRGNLKVEKKTSDRYFDPCECMDEDDRKAYSDFRKWYMELDWLPVMDIPKKGNDEWFPPYESDDAISFAFSSTNFKKLHGGKFNHEAWQVRKVFEKLEDLAQTHSVLTDDEGMYNIRRRYIEEVRVAWGDKAKYLKWLLCSGLPGVNKVAVLKKITVLNSRVKKAKEIWKNKAFEP